MALTAGRPISIPMGAAAKAARLDGGMRLAGRVAGTGSFSRARYTKCIAYSIEKICIYNYTYKYVSLKKCIDEAGRS